MALEQLFLNLAIGLGVGGSIAAVAKWASGETWDPRKFVQAIVIGGFSSLTIIQGLEGGNVTEGNLTMVILAIIGTHFGANKGVQILQRLKPQKKK